MPTVAFLGWRDLEILPRPGGGWNVKPPNAAPREKLWQLGDLVIVPGDGGPVLACKPLKLTMGGLDLLLEVKRFPLVPQGSDFRPDPTGDGKLIVLKLGSAGSARTMLIGPIRLDDPNATITFDPTDPSAIGRYRSDFAFPTGGLTGDESALWMGLAPGRRLGVDLKGRQLVLSPGSLESRLQARKPGVAAHAGRFRNEDVISLQFADIAAGTDRTFDANLMPGDVAPLNVDPATGKAGIEIVAGRASVTLKRTNGPGAIATAVAVTAAQGKKYQLRLNALRNSRNKAERWAGEIAIPLVFRTPAPGQWHSPLIGPRKPNETSLPRLSRLDDLVSPGKPETLPMHSWLGASQFELQRSATATLVCSVAASTRAKAATSWLEPTLQWRATRPWIRLEHSTFRHMRPGNAWRDSDNTWAFAAGSATAAAPILSEAIWRDGETGVPAKSSPLAIANGEINDMFSALKLSESDSTHETGIADQTKSAGGATGPAITAVIPNGDVAAGEVRLAQHSRTFAIAAPKLPVTVAAATSAVPMKLPVALPNGQAMEYAVAWPALQNGGAKYPWVWLSGLSDWAKAVSGAIDPDAPIAVADLLADLQYRPTDFPLAILKITRTRTLADLLGDLSLSLSGSVKTAFEAKRKIVQGAISDVDPTVLEAPWVGLVLFDSPIDFDAFPLLKAVVPSTPKDAPRMAFLSVAPRDPNGTSADVAISASVDWTNSGSGGPPGSQDEEGSFQPRSLSIAFRDRQLVKFHSEADLTLYSFLGLKAADKAPKTIKLIGSARRVAGTGKDSGTFELRFEAEIADGEKLIIFPLGQASESAKTFIKSISFRRVAIVDAPGASGRKPEIEIDGAIEFQKPDYDFGFEDFFKQLSGVGIDFSSLRIELPDISGPDAQFLKIQYPSLRFNLDLPHLALLGEALKLKFQQLIVDWSGKFDLGQFPSLHLPNTGDLRLDLPRIVLGGRLDFGSLPDLFARSLSGFNLDGIFALNFDKNGLPFGLPFIGVGGFGFDRLDLDLLSFIRLKIDHLQLGKAPWTAPPNGSALSIVNASLDVLDVNLLRNGNGAFFSSDGDSGNGFWAAFDGVDLSLFKLEWGFVGQNIDFPPELPKALLAPPPEQSEDEDLGAVGTALVGAWNGGKIRPAAGNAARGWTFGAGISAFEGAFRGRALIQDGGFVGLALYGEALRKLFGYNFVFVGIYRKDITPGEDYFYFSVTLPPMTFGGIHFTGGAIAAEIFTSGDFMLDFGFPWRALDGGRQWERTIGAIVTPGQATGGFYVRKRRSHNPTTGKKELTVAGGVAFEWGLGAAFGGGVFEVWVRIGIYAIIEGEVVIDYDSITDVKIVAFTLQGAVGLLLQGEGKIDWWIISIRVGITASAEIRAALIWDSRTGDNRVLMPIEAEVSVSAYAEACIGGGCARICRGIHVSLDIPVRYQLQFG